MDELPPKDMEALIELQAALTVPYGYSKDTVNNRIRDALSLLLPRSNGQRWEQANKGNRSDALASKTDGSLAVTIKGTMGAEDTKLFVASLETKMTSGHPSRQNDVYVMSLGPYYLHKERAPPKSAKVVTRKKFKMVLRCNKEILLRDPKLPVFLLDIHGGSLLDVRGAVFLPPHFVTHYLASVSLLGPVSDTGRMQYTARIIRALRKSFTYLQRRYDDLAEKAKHCHEFLDAPTSSFADGIMPIQFFAKNAKNSSSSGSKTDVRNVVVKCREQLTQSSSQAFLAEAAVSPVFHCGKGIPLYFNSDRKAWQTTFVVEFSRVRYGWQAHRNAADAGHAPKLLGVTRLCSDWVAVAMEHLGEGWMPLTDLPQTKRSALGMTIMRAYKNSFGTRFVHGDIREENILVKQKEKPASSSTSPVSHQVMFVDFDRSGFVGKTRYPLWAATKQLRDEEIQQSDEIAALEKLCINDDPAAHRGKRRRVECTDQDTEIEDYGDDEEGEAGGEVDEEDDGDDDEHDEADKDDDGDDKDDDGDDEEDGEADDEDDEADEEDDGDDEEDGDISL
jgi:hypothetical protein